MRRVFLFLTVVVLFGCRVPLQNRINGNVYVYKEDEMKELFSFNDNDFLYVFQPNKFDDDLFFYTNGKYRSIDKDKVVIEYDAYRKCDLLVTELEDSTRTSDSILVIFEKNVNYRVGNYQDEMCVSLNDNSHLINSSFGRCVFKAPRPLKQFQLTFVHVLSYITDTYQIKNPNSNVIVVDYRFSEAWAYYTTINGLSNNECRYHPDLSQDIQIFKEGCILRDTLRFKGRNSFYYAGWPMKKKGVHLGYKKLVEEKEWLKKKLSQSE